MTNESDPSAPAQELTSPPEVSPPEPPVPPSRFLQPGTLIGDRYEARSLINEVGPLQRYRGLDIGSGLESPLPIILLRQVSSRLAPTVLDSGLSIRVPSPPEDDPFLADTKVDNIPEWPSLAWEKRLLARTAHLSLPRILDTFDEDGFEYLVEEVPLGRSFWDAWDDPPISWTNRCTWLIQIAEALEQLHLVGALIEGLRPDIIVVTPTKQAVIADLSDLLPLPPPADTALQRTLYTAPELLAGSDRIDARADLYSFGAMVHALMLGRELTELDFTFEGVPRPFLERFPDGHPLLGRLLARTFVHNVSTRFPSHDLANSDPTGFREMISVVEACARALETIRLDIAGWTNTGVVRSGNEDALAILHSSEARLEVSDDFSVIILADGMGGMASGEVASSLTIQSVRNYFLRHPPFTDLIIPPAVPDSPLEERTIPIKPMPPKERVLESLYEANRFVNGQGQRNLHQRGMGCTAEVVLIDGKNVWIGHVGDSRVYHARLGKLTQITQDHTLVSQLVALGQLTVEEAENHPQRSELQQAIGGRPDVYPDVYNLTLEVGDWLLVCTDGLSNQLDPGEIITIMQSAGSAEKAARRLVNHAIVKGAYDNVSVVVVRAC